MSRLPSTKRSRSGQARRRRTVHFPTDRPYGRLLLRDREEMAHDLPEWRRMWRRCRIDLARRLRYMGLAADVRTGMLHEEERWFWGEYEGATWQRERVARGDVAVRAADEVWLQITDERCDLSQLEALRRTGLWGLSLEYSVADDAINYIAGLTDLRRLYLEYDNTITDSGLARLSALSMLKDLAIDGPCLTDAGMAHLPRLTRLRSLQLDCPRVSIASVARAVRTLQIEELFVDLKEPLSDADVPYLCQLPATLRYLVASRKGLSRTGVAALERALPGCYLELRWLDAPALSEHVGHDDACLIDLWSIQLPRRRLRTKPGRARDRWRDAQRNALIGPLIPVSVDNRQA